MADSATASASASATASASASVSASEADNIHSSTPEPSDATITWVPLNDVDDHPLHRTPDRRVSNDRKLATLRRSRSDPASFRKYLSESQEQGLEDEDGDNGTADPISSLRKASSKGETSTIKLPGGVDSSTNGVSFDPSTTNNSNPNWRSGMKKARRFSSSAATPDPGTPTGLGSSMASINTTTTTTTSKKLRVYRSSLTDKKTTRDIAALDFLLGIPLEAEESIVQNGWMLQQRRKQTFRANGIVDEDDDELYGSDDDYGSRGEDGKREETTPLEPPGSVATTAQLASHSNSHHGRWWEKWVPRESTINNSGGLMAQGSAQKRKDDGELESPTATTGLIAGSTNSGMALHGTPGKDNIHNSYHSTASGGPSQPQQPQKPQRTSAPIYAPGRRLEGDEAVLVQIPLKIDTVTRQKSIARQAAIREWEIKVAHGLTGMEKQANDNATTNAGSNNNTPTQKQRQQQPLLDGRLFFSASGSYPMGVFSLKRYEPKREEAAQRRMKLEARGGGGSHFVMPSRDWRGITFRALLPRKALQARNQKAFNRFLRSSTTPARAPSRTSSTGMHKSPASKRRQSQRDDSERQSLDESNISDDEDDDSDSSVSSSSSAEDAYIPGILDDPEMVLGRHRNVMIGDCITGCIVASTIQFVKPALLKADLNQKFRERFDGWEPNKSQRKYIGARVVNGIYTLIDPTESQQQQVAEDASGEALESTEKSNPTEPLEESSDATPAIIRMPPSLTLSKIRSAKRQALMAFVNANLEIGTVALAFVYFERLCLSCRVDKSNRRLCFASCLLLACKINEPNEVLVMKENTNVSGTESGDEDEKKSSNRKKVKRLESSIRPSKRSSRMFASLLEFFTEVWSLSLKHLFAAEWGVFAALRFSLHATPSQVAFHFKRLMKTLEWNPAQYLGPEMFEAWQESLATEEEHKLEREKRRERRRVRKQRRLERELQKEIRGKHQMAEKDPLRKRANSKGKATTLFQLPELKPKVDQGARGKKAESKKAKFAWIEPSEEGKKRPSISTSTPPGGDSSSEDVLLGPGRPKPPRRSNSSNKRRSGDSRSPGTSPLRERLSFPGMLKPSIIGTSTSTSTTTTNAASWNARAGGGEAPPNTPTASVARKNRQMNLLTRLGMRRPASSEKLFEMGNNSAREMKSDRVVSPPKSRLFTSPSMPQMALPDCIPLEEEHHEEVHQQKEPSKASLSGNNDDPSETNGESVAIDMPPDDESDKEKSDKEDDDDDLGIII